MTIQNTESQVQPQQEQTAVETSATDDFFSDAPMACPMRKPGDDSEICEACQ